MKKEISNQNTKVKNYHILRMHEFSIAMSAVATAEGEAKNVSECEALMN